MRFEKPLALLLTLSAAACATPRSVQALKPVATEADLHEIAVSQSGARLEIPLSAAGSFGPELSVQLDEFGSSYRSVGHGPLLVSTPVGAGDTDAAARTAQAVRMQLVEKGVPYAAIAGGTYDAAGRASAPIVLSFTRFEAAAPDCQPVWKENLANTMDNRVSENFGCSINANLAAMIADPADLQMARASDPRDAARRDVVMGKYREGDPSHATRSEDERVALSKAIR